MPKSKRNKQIELAKTKKRGLDWKKGLLDEVRSCVDSYTNVFVFSVNDMRNAKMKTVREQWKDSRFFIGKNKIMAMALGKSAEEEYKPNLHKIGLQIKGQCGLLFSNKSTEEVLNWFRSYAEGDFARSGNIATEDVKLPFGLLPMFPHSLEPYLRQLGLPTSLVKGEIHLVKEHEVCKEGDTLTPESAKILKLLGYEMAEFHITIECMWSHDGSFMQLTDRVDTNSKENIKKVKKNSIKTKKHRAISECPEEKMEVELDEGLDEVKEAENLLEDTAVSLTAVSSTPVTNTSTPVVKIKNTESRNEVQENKMVEVIDIEDNETEEVIDIEDDETEEVIDIKDNETEEVIDVKDNETEEVIAFEETQVSDTLKEDASNIGNSHPVFKRTRKSKVSKRDSLPKTPDANTSHDSPVFRQLRNRSVKVSRKRK